MIKHNKITKYFITEPRDENYGIFKKSETPLPIQSQTTHIQQIQSPRENHYRIGLISKLYNNKTYYCLYFPNSRSSNISSVIDNPQDEIQGDLEALHECLRYLVYNPNLYTKLNREKLLIITNSPTISSIFVSNFNSITNNKLYFKIHTLLKYIKNISIEIGNINEFPLKESLEYIKVE